MLGSMGASLPSMSASAASITTEDFRLDDITMTDAYCTNAFEKEMDYLLAFDTNRLLAGFPAEYLLGQNALNGEQAYAADVCADAAPDVFDLALLKRQLVK